MASDDLTFDVAANDKASATLNKVEKNVDSLGGSANKWEASLQKVDTSGRSAGASMAGLGTKLGIAGAAIGGAVAGATKLYQVMSDAEQVATLYSKSLADVQLAIENTGVSQAEAADSAERMNDQIRQLADDAGMRLPRVADAAEQLTFRLGDAGAASSNLRRLVGLMARTGEDAEQVGKDLAEALDGDINAMKELGILSDSQVQKFNQMSDRGARTAEVMGILDQKLSGVIEQNKATQSSSERVSKSFERLKASIGSLAVVEAPLNGVAELVEKAAAETEAFAGVWDEKTPGIKARIAEIEASTRGATDQTKRLKEELESVSDPTNQAERLRKIAKQRADTQLYLLDQQIERRDDLYETDLQVELARKRINEQLDRELANIESRFGAQQQALGAQQQQLEILRLQTMAAEATNEADKARYAAQAQLLSVQIEYANKLDETEATQQRQLLMQESELKERKIQADLENRLASIRRGNAQAAETEAEVQADIGMTVAERRRLEERITQEYRDRFAATDRELQALKDSVTATDQQADNLIRGAAARAESLEDQRKIREEMEAEENAIKARAKANRISRGASIATGAGQAAGGVTDLLSQASAANEVAQDATEAERARAEQIRRNNEELSRQIGLYSDLSSTLGTVGESMAKLTEEEWDFAKAGEASMSALNAVSSAGKATAGILGKNTRQQAGIQAGFEAAAAAGALGLAIANPAMPQFYAASAQHAAAAGMYTAVAAGAGSGTSASVGGGGGGGGAGGGGGSRPSLNVDDQREKTVNAFAEALQKEREPRQIVNYNNFGAGSLLADAPSVGREIDKVTREAQSATMTRGRNG